MDKPTSEDHIRRKRELEIQEQTSIELIDVFDRVIRLLQQDDIHIEERLSLVEDLNEKKYWLSKKINVIGKSIKAQEEIIRLTEQSILSNQMISKKEQKLENLQQDVEELKRDHLKRARDALADIKGSETDIDTHIYNHFKNHIVQSHQDISTEARDAIFELGAFYGRYIAPSEQALERKVKEKTRLTKLSDAGRTERKLYQPFWRFMKDYVRKLPKKPIESIAELQRTIENEFSMMSNDALPKDHNYKRKALTKILRDEMLIK